MVLHPRHGFAPALITHLGSAWSVGFPTCMITDMMIYEICVGPQAGVVRLLGLAPEMTLRVTGMGPRDRLAAGGGEVPVESIIFTVDTFDDAFVARLAAEQGPDAGLPFIDYRLGDLTGAQAERVLALLAGSGLLEGLFGIVPDGEHRALVADAAAARRAGEWITATAAQVRETGEDAMPEGWKRYRTDMRTGWSGTAIWPAGDAAGYVSFFGDECPRGLLAWPEGDPGGAAMARADRWLAALTASSEVAPVPRRVLAATAWRAGFRNIQAIAGALGAHRETIYRDLRAAGYEPTEH